MTPDSTTIPNLHVYLDPASLTGSSSRTKYTTVYRITRGGNATFGEVKHAVTPNRAKKSAETLQAAVHEVPPIRRSVPDP